MSGYKYDRADLLWEATRRNEDYKSHYQEVLKELPVDKKAQWTRDNHSGNGRWNIRILRDPLVTIDEIKKKIDSGVNPEDVHPYYHVSKKFPIIQHKIPKLKFPKNMKLDTINVDAGGYKPMMEFANQIKDRIVVSFNPHATNKSIIEKIKQIKLDVLEQEKQENNELKKSGKAFYYPRDINNYVGRLRKYDDIIDHLKMKDGSDSLNIQKGVIILPKGFKFADVVPDVLPNDRNFETVRKSYKDSYEGSVQLIQLTPNIFFSPSRT